MNASDLARAEKLFRDFHGREPTSRQIRPVTMQGTEIVLEIGKLVGVIYKTTWEAKPFIHRFKPHNRPVLFVSADGHQMYSLNGDCRFTARGFTG